MEVKTFTLQEANQRLPLVKKIVKDIVDKGKLLKDQLEDQTVREISEEDKKIVLEVEGLINELGALGCYYKDFNFMVGFVDFPSVIDGENVFLCWRSDEESITWYHPMNKGYDSRKPIPEDLS